MTQLVKSLRSENPLRCRQEAGLIQKRLEKILRQIRQACLRSGRTPDDVRLIGASKYQSIENLVRAVQAGLRDFGENYEQELTQKKQALAHECPQWAKQLEWHFIGRLQRRKVRRLIGHVDWIQSLDRVEHAREIQRWAAQSGVAQQVLVQVHQGEESSKGGVAPADLASLLQACRDLSHVHIRGLMTLPPYHDDVEQVRSYFRALRQLRDAINQEAVYKEPLTQLSMGMSHDFEVAIEEGATMVRIGTALFGERPEPAH